MINLSEIKAKFTPIVQDDDPEKWLELRKTGIGGSDAGAIMGLNKYSSPLTIYMAKKGIENDFNGNKSTEWGHILEDPIRKAAEKDLQITIESIPGMFTSLEYPFMNANLDGICEVPENHVCIINGVEVTGKGGHEIKTSAKGDGFSEEEIPDSYYCQVQHYMAVTGLPWFILTVFILESKTVKHYVVPKNDSFIEQLIEVEKNFWENNVIAEVMPSPVGIDSENDYLKNLPLDSVVELPETVLPLITEERELDEQIKELNQKLSGLKNQILIEIYKASKESETAEKTTATVGDFKITYNQQVRKSIDNEKLKTDGLYDKYCKESVSKVLRISEVKQKS